MMDGVREDVSLLFTETQNTSRLTTSYPLARRRVYSVKANIILLQEGFVIDVRNYITTTVFGDELLQRADMNRCQATAFSPLRYFMDRFPWLLPKKVTG